MALCNHLALHSFILSGDSFSGLEYFPKHTRTNQHSAEYWEPSGVFSFPVLCPTNSSHLGFLRLSPCLLNSVSLLGSTYILPPVPAPGKSLWGSIPGQLLSSPRLFPIPQGSLSFTAWCPDYWKLLFYMFFHFSFVSKLRVNLVPVISPWLEAECRRYVIPFGPCY